MKFVQARHFYKGGNVPRLIVIHDMEYPERPTGAEWCADFFAGPNAPKASAHFCVDNDSVVQCVKEEDGAWHTPGALPGKGGEEINRISIGIEHAGYAKQTREEWLDSYSTAMLDLSAALVARLCKKYDIAPRRLDADDLKAGRLDGICGHVDCTQATGVGSHWDPGPGFPWDWYLNRVIAYSLAIESKPEADGWARVECGGVLYDVALDYIWPISIGGAEEMAAELGCELPTPELVDAIWAASTWTIDATKMAETHNGTMAEMAGIPLINRHAEKIEKEMVGCPPGALVAGHCKDVVRHPDGRIGLYGWQRLDGTVVQGFYSQHSRGWIDYSQGLRLVRRVK